ncbi:vacuolar protein sorting-associated protein [Ordospora colligata]|nr:vacuolar protein sorting-associated protein [Ordospora colligata]
MLKRILLRMLNRVLGSYVENIDRHQIELGIFKGHVSVTNLRIKPCVISRIFKGRVICNSIGKLHIKVPWKSFNRHPVEIHIRDVEIKLGKTDFCWCFADGGLCQECSALEVYEVMRRLDQLNLFSDDDGNSVLFADLMIGNGPRVLIENISIEYVSGVPMGISIRQASFNAKHISSEECKGSNLKRLDIAGIETTGLLAIIQPFDVFSIISMINEKPCIETRISELSIKTRQTVVQEIMARVRDYEDDGVRWKLFRMHDEYKMLLKMIRDANGLNQMNDAVDDDQPAIIRMLECLVRLQIRIIESRGVLIDDIPDLVVKVREYTNLLDKHELTQREIERKNAYEREMCLERLLRIRRIRSNRLKNMSWKSLFYEQSIHAQEGNPVKMQLNVLLEKCVFEFVDDEGQGVLMILSEVSASSKDFLSGSSMRFKVNESKGYFIDARKNGHEPYCELASHFIEGKCVLAYEGAEMCLNGYINRWMLYGYQKELIHVLGMFARIVRNALPPSYMAYGFARRFRVNVKIRMVTAEFDILRLIDAGEGKRHSVVSENVSVSYLDDSIARRRVGSLRISSVIASVADSVTEARIPLSNSIEVSVLYVDGVFYVKTSMMDLYMHEVPAGKARDGMMFPSGFIVPNFEVCSDTIKINVSEGVIEVEKARIGGNGGSLMFWNVYGFKLVDGDGRRVFCVPKMKMSVRLHESVFVDVEYLRIRGGYTRMLRKMNVMMGGGFQGLRVVVNIERLRIRLSGRRMQLKIDVDEFKDGYVKKVTIWMNASMLCVNGLIYGESLRGDEVKLEFNKEDLYKLMKVYKFAWRIYGAGYVKEYSMAGKDVWIRNVQVNFEGLVIRMPELNCKAGEFGMNVMPMSVIIYEDIGSECCDQGVAFELVDGLVLGNISRISVKIHGEVSKKVVNAFASMHGCVMEMLDEVEMKGKDTKIHGYNVDRDVEIMLDTCVWITSNQDRLNVNGVLMVKMNANRWDAEVSVLEMKTEDMHSVRLNGIHAANEEGKLLVCCKRMDIGIEIHMIAGVFYAFADVWMYSEILDSKLVFFEIMNVNIENVILCYGNNIQVIKLREVRYDGGCKMYYKTAFGTESIVEYRKRRGKKGGFVLSVQGGCCDASMAIDTMWMFLRDCLKACEILKIEAHGEEVGVIIMGVEGLMYKGLMKICVPIGYLKIDRELKLSGRVVCSTEMYECDKRRFVPVVEENVYVIGGGCDGVSVNPVNRLRVSASKYGFETIFDVFQGFTKNKMGYRKVRVKNVTGMILIASVMRGDLKVEAGEVCDLEVWNCEQGIRITNEEGSSGGYLEVCIGQTSIDIDGQRCILSVDQKDDLIIVTIVHSLTVVNQCELAVCVRIRYSNEHVVEIEMQDGAMHTVCLCGDFVLEIGLGTKYNVIGRMNMGNVEQGIGWRCMMDREINVGVDIFSRNESVPGLVIMIVYPVFEIVNKAGFALDLALWTNEKHVVEELEDGLIRKNILFSLSDGESRNVYGIDASEYSLLSVLDVESGKSAKVFSEGELIRMWGKRLMIKKESCVIDEFFGKHDLMCKTRIVICPYTVVINNLSRDVMINGCVYQKGKTCADLILTIRDMEIGGYRLDVPIAIDKVCIAEVVLLKKTVGADDLMICNDVKQVNMNTEKMVNELDEDARSHSNDLIDVQGIVKGKECRIGMQPRQMNVIVEFRQIQEVKEIEIRHACVLVNNTRFRLLIVSENEYLNVEAKSTGFMKMISDGMFLFAAESGSRIYMNGENVYVPADIVAKRHFSLKVSENVLFGISRMMDNKQQIFTVIEESEWPYAICNSTQLEVKFVQDRGIAEHVVSSRSICWYALESMMFEPIIVLEIYGTKIPIQLNKNGTLRISAITVCVFETIRCRVVHICEDLQDLRNIGASIVFDAAETSISLMDVEGTEVLCVNLVNTRILVKLRYGVVHLLGEAFVYENFEVDLQVGSVQIDNQALFCVFPVIVYPLKKSKRIGRRRIEEVFASLRFEIDRSVHCIAVSEIHCSIREFALNIEEMLVKKIVKIFDVYEFHRYAQKTNAQTWIRISRMKIEQMEMKINFLKDVESGFVSSVLGFLINSISDFSMEIDGMWEDEMHTSTDRLINMISDFYLAQFKSNLCRVFAHLDIIGNIGSLTESVSMGMKGLLAESVSGGTGTTRGIVRGGKSLLKNTVFGVSNTVGKFSRSVSAGVTLVTFDAQKRKSIWCPYTHDGNLMVPSKNHKGVVAAIYKETGGLIKAISHGVTGIATAPIRGASRGVSGVMKGLGKGFIGAFTKPIVGVADLVANVSETIKMCVDGKVLRIQYPRPYIDEYGYDEGLCQGFYIFSMMIKRSAEERFIDASFGTFNTKCQLILTTRRLLLLNKSDMLDVCVSNVDVDESHYVIISVFKVSVERASFINSIKQMKENLSLISTG